MKLIFTDQYANIILLLNGLIILFYIGAIRRDKQRAMKFGNYETLEKIAGRSFIRSHNIFLLVRIIAVTALLVGISNPVLTQKAPSSKSDYVLAIDSSSSMLTQDFQPSRFEAAKQLSSDFITKLPDNSRTGAVSFSGDVRVDQEMTMDKEKAASVVKNMEIGDQAGTAMGDAISTSTSLLLQNNRSGAVILLTDGRNNVGSSVNDSVEYAANNNVTVHTIGIGSSNRTGNSYGTIGGENASRAGFPNLDTGQLETIANRTGGEFITVTNRSGFRNALLGISNSTVRRDISNYLIILGVGLLVLEWFVATTRFSVIP